MDEEFDEETLKTIEGIRKKLNSVQPDEGFKERLIKKLDEEYYNTKVPKNKNTKVPRKEKK